MKTPLKNYVSSEQLKCSGAIGKFFQPFRILFCNLCNPYRDVFFDGNEKIVIRTDARYPDEAPRKYKVAQFLRYDTQIQGQYLFKEGIEPKYEDEHNKNGGHMRLAFASTP